VSEAEILQSRYSVNFYALADSIANRARKFYTLAARTLPEEDRRSMAAAELMGAVYWQLLRKLEGKRFNVFGPQKIKLSRSRKLSLIIQSWLRYLAGVKSSSYGSP
jgi:phytoene synthase